MNAQRTILATLLSLSAVGCFDSDEVDPWSDVACDPETKACSATIDGERVVVFSPDTEEEMIDIGRWENPEVSECTPPEWEEVVCWETAGGRACAGVLWGWMAPASDPCEEPPIGFEFVDVRGLLLVPA